YGLIWDREFFCWLEEHIHALRNRDPDALSYAIEKSCTIKAHVVAADERESGIRAILNLGHTFGHAIEAAMGYGSWLHGEAVGAGMCLAASLSHQLGWISADQLESAVALVQAGGLPIKPPADMTTEQFLRYMSVDKKNIEGKIRLVLLRGIGDSLVTDEVAESTLREFLSECLNDHQ
ncbi:3-dehydroquinate synthase family protein, partial [Sedimenticola sp.]|uniref:3-dehydroquinate synthase family protein n=1 Tax=Sedimenticola sp. TaxID=1940285 RepID=UPI003D13E839